VKESENGTLAQFKRRQIVDARLLGSSVSKTATLLGLSRANAGIHESSEDNISEEEQ
jgi:hypothetical protein